MAWEEHHVVEIRERFVLRAQSPKGSMSALCREFGVSRKTGYKWLERFGREGLEGLKDRSRRPRLSARVDGETVLRVLELHARYRWGPKKLHTLLAREERGAVVSVRTIARILRRAGIGPRRRRRLDVPSSRVSERPRVEAHSPNDVWTVDFKGWWSARNGERCEPLTVRDAFSRYVLCARIVESHSTAVIQREFERLFRKYGLPKTLQFDNGEPFVAVQARAGITRLSAWWVSLGIKLVRSRPGKPQDNGGHERMHGDIAFEIQREPASTRLAQQRALTSWRRRFNEERPHEALQMQVPAECYEPSERPFLGPQPPQYESSWPVRRVSAKGFIKMDGVPIFLGEGLVGQHVGLKPLDLGHQAWFYEIDLGIIRTAA